MNISTNVIQNDIALRNQIITTMLEEVKPMVYNFSRKFELEFDDCLQEASLLMLEVWPKAPVSNIKPYLHGTVRRGLYKMLRPGTLSLEAERNEDGATFLDMLQAYESKRSEDELDYLDKVTEVVHSVLSKCRIEEQEYAVRAFELPDYTPVPPTNHPHANYPRKRDKPRRANQMRESVKRTFRKHPQVQALVSRTQHETAIL